MTTDPLVAAAMEARLKAYAPFSHFNVGAALEAEDGTIVPGCNVESASYGLTICAERVAVFSGVARGFHCFKRVAIVVDTTTLTPPCGACRQILWEFAPESEVILANLSGNVERYTMKELLPRGFDAKQLTDTKHSI